MGFADILTYISILIAIRALLPDYQKLKLWLASIFRKFLFWISISLIILLSFHIFSWYYSNIETLLIKLEFLKPIFKFIFWNDLKTWIFSILRITQLSSILFIYKTAKLNSHNKTLFKKLIDNLYNNKQYNTLIKIINENIDNIIYFTRKQKKIKDFFSKFEWKFLIEYNEDSTYTVNTNKKKWYQKIFFPIIQSFKVFLLQEESLTWYLPNKAIINEIFHNEENLWYKIIQLSEDLLDQQDIKKFIREFLKEALKDKNSRLSQCLWWLDYEPIEINNELLILLQKIGKKIDYGKIIDEIIHNIIKEEKNKELLNREYSPSWNEYYDINRHITSHIWHLIRSYKLIWSELDLWNMPRALILDIIEITDRSKYQDNYYEYTTATYYLISEYFNEIEYLCDNIDTRYLWVYLAMIQALLESELVIDNVKSSIIHGVYYFLCNWKNKNIKKTALTNFFSSYGNDIKKYFQLDWHDKITYYLDSTNKDIYNICRI